MKRETIEIMLEDTITWNKEDRADLSLKQKELVEGKKQLRYWLRRCKELDISIHELEEEIKKSNELIKTYKEELAESEE